ncbi:TolC family protein [Singulisphaera acidiphila]|uniref:Outer membrane protein n=1 Tax=Singulisphaera acidiphila (strain ATCC BAA-1392 / DSM 18658 / VKM B-2454 / MOB10) TaxID=886293 RepID=L0DHW2_SINAD|nr:TolC family protein [Singulisphaera acidiphila]AGA28964.1 hypothetical protein Sinac_4801 [Singulisphaera acidiphila DSM 18658]
MTLKAQPTNPSRRFRFRVPLLVVLALGTQSGCTREFFREWANQDVTEAIFEKSRDPRWRIDLFSVEPPALSRFADPYDPDAPPAPPDDYAAEATSPVPQWPDNRLIIPLEGTGYLDMLDVWQRENEQKAAENEQKTGENAAKPPRRPSGTPRPTTAPTEVEPPVPPASIPSPFGTGGNSGTPLEAIPPNSLPTSPPANPPSGDPKAPQARVKSRDPALRLAAFQQTGIEEPTLTQSPTAPPGLEGPRRPENQPPPIGMDPSPIQSDLSAPLNPRPDLTPEQYRESEEKGDAIAGMLIPDEINFNEAEAAGLPRNSRPYKLTMEQAFRLGLVNARFYQFQLENVYTTSLAVTLQRFAFQPQFYAGLSPLTGTAAGGIPAPNPFNQFLYRTRETGTPISSLNVGTVAGVGKVFNSGGRLLMGFANQVVFNFLGQNSRQPSVQSFLPLTFVQPFLRGGGRAVTLEALTQAERNLLYAVRSFAKFRQEFVVATLVGGTPITNFGSTLQTPGFSGGGNSDPTIGFLNVIQDIQLIENDRKNIAALERLYMIYSELIKGEASGLTQLQVDQVDQSYQQALQTLVNDRTQFRSQLDQFKIQLGMPPDVPLILDRSLAMKFKEVFDGIDDWQRDPKRNLTDLPQYAANLPDLADVNIDGRSVLSVYNTGKDNEDDLEDLLLAAERVTLEHRLDLMNERARLYDAWRQIRVSANALKGIFNVTLTNQFITPPATTNPFAFVDQAKQFSLVLNAELPLVRLNERNQFRATLIGYERQRRSLQAFEDNLKYQIRIDVRNLHQQYLTYEINRKNFTLAVRLKDQAFEQIIAPPQGAAGASGTAQAANAATQTNNLINFQRQLLTQENTLITNWLGYETARLTLYRDLGTLPYDEWEAYRELFPADYGNAGTGGGSRAIRPPGAPRPEEAGQP